MITLDEMLALKELLWPRVRFYDRQVEMIESWCSHRETVVAAGTEEGKDFCAGFINLATFLICQAKGLSCKLLTISVEERHLKVLWGEIGRFVQTSSRPLLAQHGGPLVVNYQEIRRAEEAEAKNPFNYLQGVVYEREEKMQGHYADFNGVTGDEASALDDAVWRATQPMKRFLWFGNTNKPKGGTNFFRRLVKEGSRAGRKVIHMTALDSPNVKQALREMGEPGAGWSRVEELAKEVDQGARPAPSNRIVTPGVLTWDRLQTYLLTWDELLKRIKLRAEFPDDSVLMLWPEAWLSAAHGRWKELAGAHKRQAKSMGVDVGDVTSCWCVGDEHGALHLEPMTTPSTTAIIKITLDLGRRWNVPPERWVFDAGGGGKHQADRLREMGFPCQAVGFGEKAQVELRRGLTRIEDRKEVREDKSAYVNLRVQMHWEAAMASDPLSGKPPYAIAPPEQGPQWLRLWQQMSAVPKDYDDLGKAVLPPKEELAAQHWGGVSPHELDSYVLMHWGLTHRSRRATAGAV